MSTPTATAVVNEALHQATRHGLGINVDNAPELLRPALTRYSGGNRIHPQFSRVDGSNRIRSTHPNLTDFRKHPDADGVTAASYIEADTGEVFVTVAVPRLELHAYAALTRDQNLIAALNADDPYGWYADQSGVSRDMAKTLLTGMPFNIGPDALVRRHDITETEAQLCIAEARRVFVVADAWARGANHGCKPGRWKSVIRTQALAAATVDDIIAGVIEQRTGRLACVVLTEPVFRVPEGSGTEFAEAIEAVCSKALRRRFPNLNVATSITGPACTLAPS